METEEQCNGRISGNWRLRRCTRKAVKDGWCKQHHPDAVAKRKEKSGKYYREQLEKSPYMLLQKEKERTKQLEDVIASECNRLWHNFEQASRKNTTLGTVYHNLISALRGVLHRER